MDGDQLVQPHFQMLHIPRVQTRHGQDDVHAAPLLSAGNAMRCQVALGEGLQHPRQYGRLDIST
jgi:hypothetical protein